MDGDCGNTPYGVYLPEQSRDTYLAHVNTHMSKANFLIRMDGYHTLALCWFPLPSVAPIECFSRNEVIFGRGACFARHIARVNMYYVMYYMSVRSARCARDSAGR